MRSIINFGGPINQVNENSRFRNIRDHTEKQMKSIIDFQQEINKMAVQYTYFDSPEPLLKASFYSKDIISQEIKDLWRKDLYYLAASVGLVFVVLTFHFCSVFLAIICMLIIGFAFGCTGLICEYALGMTYFNIMNNFAIFIILGIAADDFIVLFDAWT